MGRSAWSERELIEYVPRVAIRDLTLSVTPEATRAYIESIHMMATWHLDAIVYSTDVAGIPLTHQSMERCGSVRFEDFMTPLNREWHSILRQRAYLGGYRYYFQCQSCGKAVKHLYIYKRTLGCRSCLGLVYQRSRDHRNQRMPVRTAIILQKRLDDLPASQSKMRTLLQKKLDAVTPAFTDYIRRIYP
jgi:hypothetical protein